MVLLAHQLDVQHMQPKTECRANINWTTFLFGTAVAISVLSDATPRKREEKPTKAATPLNVGQRSRGHTREAPRWPMRRISTGVWTASVGSVGDGRVTGERGHPSVASEASTGATGRKHISPCTGAGQDVLEDAHTESEA